MTHTLSSCKDSRFGYSVLCGVESHRFQTSAYLFRQFQVLFAIDTSANALPWEHEAVTRRLFLERIPATSLLHLSAFKDYLLSWVEDRYQALEDEGIIQLVDLRKGRYSPRSRVQKKKLTCPCGTEQILSLLLSSSLYSAMEQTTSWQIVDTAHGSNQKYAGLQLWFATDLDLAIESGAIPPQVRNSDDAKLVIRQGPIYSCCEWLRLPWRAKQHLPIDRSAVQGQYSAPVQQHE